MVLGVEKGNEQTTTQQINKIHKGKLAIFVELYNKAKNIKTREV